MIGLPLHHNLNAILPGESQAVEPSNHHTMAGSHLARAIRHESSFAASLCTLHEISHFGLATFEHNLRSVPGGRNNSGILGPLTQPCPR